MCLHSYPIYHARTVPHLLNHQDYSGDMADQDHLMTHMYRYIYICIVYMYFDV